MLRDLELRHLLALRAVAAERSFGRAAERLGFTQSAVSQQIAALERVAGTALFDRPGGPRPVELTPAGVLLLSHAEAVLDRLDNAEHELRRLLAGDAGRLVIGTFQSISVKVLPEAVGRLRRERPGVEITFSESDDGRVLHERLHAGAIDLTFLSDPEPDDRTELVTLCEDPFVVLVAADEAGRVAPERVMTAAELRRGPLIGQHDDACQALIDRGLRSIGVEPDYVFRSSDNGTVQAMVRAGMGRAVMPYLAVDPADPEVTVCALDPPIRQRTLVVARRRGRTASPASDRLVELAVEVCAALAPPDLPDVSVPSVGEQATRLRRAGGAGRSDDRPAARTASGSPLVS